MLKQITKHLSKYSTSRRHQISAGLFVLAVALIGTLLLVVSHASTPYSSFNADNGTLTSSATKKSCPGASDGNCVVFGSSLSNSSLPTVSGTTAQGQNLTTTDGTWTGSPTSYSYQWQRCTSTCTDITGATSSSYLLASADVGYKIDVVVTATNSEGSLSAKSVQTGTVTASSGNLGPLCTDNGLATGTPAPCTASSPGTFSVSADDGGSDSGSPHNWSPDHACVIERPAGLVNSPSHQVPLIFTGVNQESNQWEADVPSLKAVYVQCNGYASGGNYHVPTTSRDYGIGDTSCGANGSTPCDDIPFFKAAIQYLEGPSQNVNPNEVYTTGSSKGANVPQSLICDERTSSMISGAVIDSNTWVQDGTGPDSSAMHCPALGDGCDMPASCAGSLNHNLSVMTFWGTADSVFNGLNTSACQNNCLGTGFAASSSIWDWGAYELYSSGPRLWGSYFGCSSSPAVNTDLNSAVNYQVFSSCSKAAAPGRTAVGMLQANACGHQPETCGGWSLTGSINDDSPSAMWNFWQTYPAR